VITVDSETLYVAHWGGPAVNIAMRLSQVLSQPDIRWGGTERSGRTPLAGGPIICRRQVSDLIRQQVTVIAAATTPAVLAAKTADAARSQKRSRQTGAVDT
jgi:hypothetical protein